MVFIMQNYTNHSELLIGQFYFVENKAVSDEAALFIFEGDLSYPFTPLIPQHYNLTLFISS